MKLPLTKELLIYIPAYNCSERIIPMIDEISPDIWQKADVLIVDNCSRDKTLDIVVAANNQNRWPNRVQVIQPNHNLGYAGSQKLAYQLALEYPNIKAVLMLHGDGQYPPALIHEFLKHMHDSNDVVYGYRSWRTYWSKDETPWTSYFTIKVLSMIESLMSGYFRKEWHSGYVMYKTNFLARINFAAITKTMHMDGHMLFAAGQLKAKVLALPIFKRYRNYPALGPIERVRYVFTVLGIIPRLHFIPVEKTKELPGRAESSLARLEEIFVKH